MTRSTPPTLSTLSTLVIPDQQRYVQEWYKDHVVDNKSTRLVLVTGAGISVAAGFPTFQEAVQKNGIKAQEILNWNTIVERQTQPHLNMFMSFVAQMRHRSFSVTKGTLFHQWVQLQEDRLDLWLTFNVDGLERKSSLLSNKVVFGHGSLEELRCNACNTTIPFNETNVSTLLRDKRIYHTACPSQNRRKANRLCWFRPTMLLYGTDPSANLYASCHLVVQNVLRKFEKRKNPQKKMILILAGLSLQQQEIRSFVASVAKWINNHENSQVVWLNPRPPFKSLLPYITLCTSMTADQFALAATQ